MLLICKSKYQVYIPFPIHRYSNLINLCGRITLLAMGKYRDNISNETIINSFDIISNSLRLIIHTFDVIKPNMQTTLLYKANKSKHNRCV